MDGGFTLLAPAPSLIYCRAVEYFSQESSSCISPAEVDNIKPIQFPALSTQALSKLLSELDNHQIHLQNHQSLPETMRFIILAAVVFSTYTLALPVANTGKYSNKPLPIHKLTSRF